MPELIKGTVKEGYVCLVKNINPHRFASKQYYQVWVEWDHVKEEAHQLFTLNELVTARQRANKKTELIPTGSKLFNSNVRLGHVSWVENKNKKHRFEAKGYFFVKLIDLDGDEGWYAFTKHQLDISLRRTLKNKEDSVKKSMLTDLFD
jgi:hypothetical protein